MASFTRLVARAGHILRMLTYAFLLLAFAWIIAVQSGCLAMRTADNSWPKKLAGRGQTLQPGFANIRAPGGRSIHTVYVRASDTLPVILFVHGSPGSADAYAAYLADTVLSRHAQLFSIDRPGFGYTSGFGKPEPSLTAQADAAKAVLDALAPGRRAVLVGHSLGGPVIADMAMRFPDRVAGLVIMGGSIDPGLEPKFWWQPVVLNPPVRWLIPKSLWTSNAEIMPLRGELERLLPYWKDVTCPVTMVHSKNDRLVPFGNVEFGRRMLVNTARFDTLVFEKGDHFVIWSQHEKVRDAILELLLFATGAR